MRQKVREQGAAQPGASTPDAERRATLWTALAVVALLACYVALGLSAACDKSMTGDEGAHVAGGVSYWAFNDYRLQPNNGNWPQRLCGLPVWLSGYRFPSLDAPAWRELRQWAVGDQFVYESGNDADAMLLRGRAMTALLGVALGLVVYFWSRQLFGRLGGLLSLALFAFSPAMLTHGFLITSDMASALGFTAAVGALWMLLHRVSLLGLLAGWLALSGLFLSKFSAPAIVPMGVVLVAVRLWNPAPLLLGRKPGRAIHGRLRQLAVFAGVMSILAIAVALTIWASYGFRYAMMRPDLATARPVPWQEVETKSELTNRLVSFAREHELLPEAYLYGFAHTVRSSQGWNSFFNGEVRRFGWLGFFPYCLATKTPLEFFAILAVAAAALWRGRRALHSAPSGAQDGRPGILYELTPLLVLFTVYWVFALTSHLNIGHRHLLPVYPPLFIMAGAAAWWCGPSANQRIAPAGPANGAGRGALTTALRFVVVTALLLCVGEGIWFWPNYLAYFNILAGGPRHGYRHLVDSSLDWSQDLKRLGRWVDTHPADAERLYFSFCGSAPPEYYGIRAHRLPSFPNRWQPHVPEPLAAGTYLVSATMLQQVLVLYSGRWNASYEREYQKLRKEVERYDAWLQTPAAQRDPLTAKTKQLLDRVFWVYKMLRFARLASYLRGREPDDEIGYSILVYRLTEEDLAQALDGPPRELLPMPEIDAEKIRRGAAPDSQR